jgi:hypothetical protein
MGHVDQFNLFCHAPTFLLEVAGALHLRLRAHRDELIAMEVDLGPRLQLASDGSLLHSPI